MRGDAPRRVSIHTTAISTAIGQWSLLCPPSSVALSTRAFTHSRRGTPEQLLAPLESAFHEPLPPQTAHAWVDWAGDWLHALREEDSTPRRDAAEIAATIRRTSPKYVPREWILHEAYSAAEEGNHQPLLALHELLKRPYDEQPAAARYFARAPPGSEQQGGIGFMS